MKENMLVIEVDHENKTVGTVLRQIEHTDDGSILRQLRENIQCSFVAYSTVVIDGEEFDFWYDDDFLGAPQKYPTWVEFDQHGYPSLVLCNNIVVVKTDGQGNETGLSSQEIVKVLKAFRKNTQENVPKFIAMVNKRVADKSKH